MGRARQWIGAVDDLPHLFTRRAQRRGSPRGGHGSRHQPQRGSLLQFGDRGGVPGRRARRRRRHLAAFYGLQRQAGAERSRLELYRRQLALGRDGRHASGPLVVRFHGPDRDEARQQTRVSQPSRHRRHGTFRRRSVRRALSDVESRARLHRHADVVRRRQPVELCLAERDPSAAGRRCGAGQCQGGVGDGQAAHEVLVRRIRGHRRVPELRPLAGGFAEQNRGLHREDQRRAAEEAARVAGRPPICSARSTRCRSAGSIRRVRQWRKGRRGGRAARRS